jgi:glycosyltransferase involved in cell wall biosynthesis
MKVALVHDYIKEYGGAERVLEALHELYPDAPVYTTVYLPEYLGPHKDRFKDWDIRTSFLQKFPLKAKLISPFRLLATFAFQQFDLSSYDVVIVSATGAYFPNSIKTNPPNPLSQGGELQSKNTPLSKGGKGDFSGPVHICYCHTPPRYLYGYATARNWKKNPIIKVLGETANHFLRMIDYKSAQNVDQFIANSEEVKARIEKFYRKDAVVVYPPVNIGSRFSVLGVREKRNPKPNALEPKTYFVAGGRLARAKHIDLIIRACRESGVPLKIFGKGFAGYESELKELSIINYQLSTSVEFLGEVTDNEKLELLAGARAYIFAGEDEDFGILPVEAMAVGTPVIAYRSGGVQETVIEGKTGVFFDELTVQSLTKAVRALEKHTFDPEDCKKRAEEFSKEKFLKNIKKIVDTAS